MGRLAGRTIIHFKDGSTLTDRELMPDQIENIDTITSVERVVQGWHLSILKSAIIKSFFIITDAERKLPVWASGPAGPPIITARSIGCYLEDSEPAVKCLLTMDPRTKNILFEVEWVKNFRPDGFAPRLEKLPKGTLRRSVSKPMGENITWTIIKEPPVRRVFSTQKGLGCLIALNRKKRTRAIAEMRRAGMNCHLLVMPEQK
jgi:hypothetical protein